MIIESQGCFDHYKGGAVQQLQDIPTLSTKIRNAYGKFVNLVTAFKREVCQFTVEQRHGSKLQDYTADFVAFDDKMCAAVVQQFFESIVTKMQDKKLEDGKQVCDVLIGHLSVVHNLPEFDEELNLESNAVKNAAQCIEDIGK